MSATNTLIKLPARFIPSLTSLAEARIYLPKAVITRQGALEWSLFYIKRGSVSIIREDEQGKRYKTATLSAGDFFGEVSFMFDVPRTAYVVANEECEVLVLERKQGKELLKKEPELHVFFERIALNRWTQTVLLASDFLPDIAVDARRKLIMEAYIRVVPAGAILFHKGDESPYLWFLISGMVDKQVGPEEWTEIEAINALNYEEILDENAPTGKCSSITECIIAGLDAEAVRALRNAEFQRLQGL